MWVEHAGPDTRSLVGGWRGGFLFFDGMNGDAGQRERWATSSDGRSVIMLL